MKKLLSMLLVLCMVMTMLPITAMAGEDNTSIDTSVEIIAFAPLAETEKTVTTSTTLEDLELPKALTATVRTTSPSAIQKDSNQQTVVDKVYSSESEESMIDIPVTWTVKPEYDMDIAGEYIFTPVIEGYTINTGLPEITITVSAPAARMMLLGSAQYNLWVGGVRVTDANKGGITGTGITGAITYNSDTKTLTLNGANITANYSDSNGNYGIYTTDNLNIVLNGINEVTAGPSNEKGSTAICVANSSLTISGDGSLTATGGSVSGITNFASCGISANQLTINNGIVAANAGTVPGNLSYGIISNITPIFNGGTITSIGNNRAIGITAPNLSDYANVQVTASENRSGTPATAYNAANIAYYQYLKFEPAASTNVAQIGSIGYATLQEAINSITDGQTIKLLKDTNGKILVDGRNVSFILDLNGKTLDGANGSAIAYSTTSSGTIRISDSVGNGKVTSQTLSDFGTINLAAGNLEIANGTIENSGEAFAIYNSGNGNIRISGGTITSSAASTAAIQSVGTGDITITDGRISATGAGSVGITTGDNIPQGEIIIVPNNSVTIEGKGGAMDRTPRFGSSPVRITASCNFEGNSPEDYNPSNIGFYKYLNFRPVPIINYDVWVAGTQVTSLNASNVLADQNATVSYTSAAGDTPQTLTLNGANINSSYPWVQYGRTEVAGIYAIGDLNIVLQGENKIAAADNNAGFSYGIYVSGNPGTIKTLTISGDGNLNANGGKIDSNTSFFSCGIYAQNITINSGTITAKAGQTTQNAVGVGIYSSAKITINGGNVTTLGDTSNDQSNGIRTHSCTINGGSLRAIANNAKNYSMGIYIQNDLIIAGGALIASGGTANLSSHGIYLTSLGEFTISGGTTTATGYNKAIASGTYIPKKLNISNVTINGGEDEASAATILDPESFRTETYKYVKFEPITHTIIYNANGGTSSMASDTATEGIAFTLPANGFTAPDGKQFKTWAIGSVFGTQVNVGGTHAFTGDTTVYALWEDIPVATHSITATAGTGGSISPSGSVTMNSGTNKTFTITPNSNYSIADVKVDNVSQGKITSYTFSNVTANHTISATFSYNGDSGDGGSGSSGGHSSDKDSNSSSDKPPTDNSSLVIVTSPSPDKPDFPTQGEIKVDGKVDEKGNATVNITDKNVTDVFDKALADAKKNGNEQNGITMILHVNTGGKAFSNITVNLPKTVQDSIIAKKIVNTIVVVDNPNIRIGMDLVTVKEINAQANSDVNITANPKDSNNLTGDAKKAIGSRPVFDLKVNYGSGKQVQSFGAGSVSVAIPYILGANEKAENIWAVYVDSNGKVHWLTNSVYDSVEKVLRFSTNHFSTYGIGYKQTDITFTDIANHWAKEDIEFVVSRGLLRGTSETTFSPNTAMTRGMFVTALGRMANADVSGYKQSNFSDVKDDDYCMGYIEWAKENGIVNGTTDGKFLPDASITREQMAVIMSNYAKKMGFTLPSVHVENTFADSEKISTYAKDSVEQMQMAGVLNGKNGNLFDPQGTATRAEASAVLRRFVELTISSDTM